MSDQRQSRKLLGWLLVPLLMIVAAGAWFAIDPAFRLGRPALDVSASMPRDEFERRVRDYILNNPEVIMEAAQRFEQRQRAAEESEAGTVLKARADEIFRDGDSPVGGNPDGDVTLVEFFDYNCPYCRQMTPVMTKAEEDNPQLRVVYKEFPILGPNSTFAAKAALAAHKQGKYVAFHRGLYQVRGAVDPSKTIEVAATVGLDVERLKADMAHPTIQAAIDKNIALAQALRINGTPGFVVGKQIFRGAMDLETLQTLIRDARAAQ